MDAEVRKDYDYYHSHFGTFDDIFNCEYNRELSPSAAYMKIKISGAFSSIGMDKAASELKESLDELGFRKFRIFDSGGYSLLLATTNGQLVKISPVKGETSEISATGFRGSMTHSSSAILQPIKTFETKKFKVSVLPEVSLEYPKNQESKINTAIVSKLAQEGFYCDDSCDGALYARNVGFLENDVPVIIDEGSIVHIDEVKPELKENIQAKLDEFKEYKHDITWEEADGTWKQHNQFPHIWNSGQPEAGKLTGVYSRDEVEAAREKIGDDADKEKILDEVTAGYTEDAARRVVDAAEEQGRLEELAGKIQGKTR